MNLEFSLHVVSSSPSGTTKKTLSIVLIPTESWNKSLKAFMFGDFGFLPNVPIMLLALPESVWAKVESAQQCEDR